MNWLTRLAKLEAQIRPHSQPTLAEAISGGNPRALAIVDGISKPGTWILPDGREITPGEFDAWAEQYKGRGGVPVIILDE
jgi:hypothetical protein